MPNRSKSTRPLQEVSVPDPVRDFLRDLFSAAVAAAHPHNCLAPHLPAPPEEPGRLLVLAAGKAAGAMAEVAEHHYVDQLGISPKRVSGIAVTRHGYGRPTRCPMPPALGRPSIRWRWRAAPARMIWSWSSFPAVHPPTGSRLLPAFHS